jgi:hypothetical protein
MLLSLPSVVLGAKRLGAKRLGGETLGANRLGGETTCIPLTTPLSKSNSQAHSELASSEK